MNVSILNSVLNNNGAGLTVSGTGTAGTSVTARKSVANYNATGISVSAATLTLADSMVTGNTESILVAGVTGDYTRGFFLTYGDNDIDGNAGGTPLAKQ